MRRSLNLAALALLALAGIPGCGKNPLLPIYGAGGGNNSPAFSASPMDLGSIQSIGSLGTLNPPQDTLPADHLYLVHGGISGLPVFAPATGLVVSVADDGNGTGSRVEIRLTTTLSYTFDHIIPDSGIISGKGVAAGNRIGSSTSATQAVCFGVIDEGVTVPRLINPARYADSTLHCASPLKYYSGSLQSELYAKVMRLGPDKDGRPDYDQAGLLVGGWFLEGQSAGGGNELAFAYDATDPSQVKISIGGILSTPGAYTVGAGDPDPATVSQAVYTISAGTLSVATVGSGRISVQLNGGQIFYYSR
jgi:hypothetical protein